MARLRCSVLGTLEVFVDDRPVTVPPGRRRAVLVCLLAHADRPVSADTLIEAAWGPDLPRDPSSSLHTVLSRLRSQLGTDAFISGPAGYRIAAEPAGVDADEFEALLEKARAADPAQARELLFRALALWRGPAFGEYADAPFACVAAARLEGMRLDAAELYASALIETGEPSTAVAPLEELLAEQPFRERSIELMMRALYHAGRPTEALQRFHDFREMLADELGLDPSPALTAAELRILGHTVTPARYEDPAELPSWLDTSTAFIGREDELSDLVVTVAANRVTVVAGPAGVGKSRLAAEALPRLHRRLGLPIAVIELTSVAPGEVAASLAEVLGLRPGAPAVAHDLVDYLSAGNRLLVLDNCEHLLPEVSKLVSELSRRCPEVRILVTSRRRLGIVAEAVMRLSPLRVPVEGAKASRLHDASAVRMFADRVRRLHPAFAVTADNAAGVAELCRRVDGLPLALELAASRVATMGLSEVLARSPSYLFADGPAARLSAAVEWSYDLLTEDERALLSCLSVFVGDFTADSVRAITAYLPEWQGDATAALAELVESSLVVDYGEADRTRFRLLAIVRAFAATRLTGYGKEETVHLAHARWVADLTAEIAGAWTRDDGAALSAYLTASAGEISAALRWALQVNRLDLAARIAESVACCFHWTPGLGLRSMLIETAEHCLFEPSASTAGGIGAGAFFLAESGELDRGRKLARTSLEFSDDRANSSLARLALAVAAMYAGDLHESARWFRSLVPDPILGGEVHASLALIACYTDDLAEARELADIALATGPSGADASSAFASYAAGEVLARIDLAQGADLLAEAAAEADRVGAEQVSRVSRIALFAILVRTARHEEAAVLGPRLLHDLRRVGAWNQIWTTMRMLAELLAASGRPADAAFFLGAADGAASVPPPVGQDVIRYAELTARLAETLGRPVLDRIRELAAATPRSRVLSRADQAIVSPAHRVDSSDE